MTTAKHYHLIVAGAGILGASCAREYMLRHPNHRVLILEKESGAARHQSGRNSGVIHAGVYYPPGSLKARYCREGLEQTLSFCRQQQIPFLQCGKLIVATQPSELDGLEHLYRRCQDNDLNPTMLSADQLRRAEPAIRGVSGVQITQTAITDYVALTKAMLEQALRCGAELRFNHQICAIKEQTEGVEVRTAGELYRADKLINCCGLHADRLIRMQGIETDFQIIPFRGEYFALPQKYNQLVSHLIYPVPDPALPFLGVHLTRMIDGSVTVGPNAVLALGRESYDWKQVNVKDVRQMLGFDGSWPLFKQYWRSGLREVHDSLSKTGYLKRVQAYCPQLQRSDLLPYRSGVRAQAVTNRGALLHDFRFVQTEHTLHLGNAPSPAATSAIPIGRAVVDKLS